MRHSHVKNLLIDEVIVEKRITDKLVEMSLSKQVATPEMVDTLRQSMKNQLMKDGTKVKLQKLKTSSRKKSLERNSSFIR